MQFNKVANKMKGYGIMDLVPIGIMFIVFTFVFSIGATILGSLQATQTTGGYPYNVTGYGLSGINEIAKWTPTLAQVIVLAVIVSVLIGALYMKFKGRGD